MKRKIILTMAMALVFALILAVSVFAEETSVHDGKVDLDAKVTLDDGTVCELFDSEGNALIWYITGKGEDGKTTYASIRADDPRIKFQYNWEGKIDGAQAYEFKKVTIELESGSVGADSIVVFNIMDDDVKITIESKDKDGNPVTRYEPANCFKEAFGWKKNLEYAFLRLDTIGIQKNAFAYCPKLKYVNVEDLTELRRMGDNSQFEGCTSLFKGKVLDLSKTKLYSIDWNNTFKNVPISGIVFPNKLTKLGGGSLQGTGIVSFSFPLNIANMESLMLADCTSLVSICINSKLTVIQDNAFSGCTSFNTIFYVGSLEQFDTLLAGTSQTGNEAFLSVANAEKISYADYLKLEDKSGKYVVYDYSYCEAYNGSNHQLSGNSVMQSVDYFKGVFFADTCTLDNCKMNVIDDSKTIGAIFVSYGYSMTEVEIGGKLSMSQFFGIDKANLEKYTTLTGNAFEYGFVVSSNADPMNEANSGLIAEGKTYITTQNGFKHDYFAVAVAGFTDATVDNALTFCVYVKDGAKVSYLDNGETVETVNMKSYNQIKALLGK